MMDERSNASLTAAFMVAIMVQAMEPVFLINTPEVA